MATISQQLIAGLQNPSMLAPLGRAAEAIGYYPTQRKKQGMLEQIQNAETNADRAKAMITYGNTFNNDQMLMAGIKLASTAKNTKGELAVANLLKESTNPSLNTAQQQTLVAQAEALAPTVGIDPSKFNTMLSSSRSRQSTTIERAANVAATSPDPQAQANFAKTWGQEGLAAFNKARASQLGSQASGIQSIKTMVNDRYAPEVAALDLKINNAQRNPTGNNYAVLENLGRQATALQQKIIDEGGSGDVLKYADLASNSLDAYQQRLIDRQNRDETLRSNISDRQSDRLFGIGTSEQNKHIPVETIIARMRQKKDKDGNPYFALTEREWSALEKDINDARETRAKRETEKLEGEVGESSLNFIKDNPTLFESVPNLDEKLKRYQSSTTDPRVKTAIGTELNKLVDAAKTQKRNENRTEVRIGDRADVMISNYIRSGDESDPFYDPRYVQTGGFMQGRSRYDLVKFYMTKKDDKEAKRLQQEVENQIRNDDSIGYREAVNNALDIIKVETPGQEGVEARQADIDEVYQPLVESIMNQAKARGNEITEIEAFELAVQQINDKRTADYNAMMQRASELRRQNRELTYGKSPFVSPPAWDLSE